MYNLKSYENKIEVKMDNTHKYNYPQTNENFTDPNGYSRQNCSQIITQHQSSTNQRPQHFLSYTMSMPMTGSMSQPLMYTTQSQQLYNVMYGSQSAYSNQNPFTHTSTFNGYTQMDNIPWIPESSNMNQTKDKLDKNNDKIVSDKLSPHNCCANQIDNIGLGLCSPLSDSFKTVTGNELNYRNRNVLDPQWFYSSGYNSQKYNELPSCSQISSNIEPITNIQNSNCCRDMNNTKTIENVSKYCSIQRLDDISTLKNYTVESTNQNQYLNNKFIDDNYINAYNMHGDLNNKNDTKTFEGYQMNTSRCELESCDMLRTPSSCLQDPSTPLSGNCTLPSLNHNAAFYPHEDMSCMELYQPSLGITSKPESQCGGESDIIVEESDEDSSEISEDCDIDTAVVYICAVCNMSCSTGEIAFFNIGNETLLTSTTQTSVVSKLNDVTKRNFPRTPTDHICSLCLNLVNTVDCLEVKLNGARKQLYDIFEKTCSVLGEMIVKEINPGLESSCENITQPENNVINNPVINTEPMLSEIESITKEKTDCEVTDSVSNKRICKICNKYFCQTDVHKHKLLHASHINFKCTLCHRSFTMKRLLDNHLKRHNGQRDFLCDRCGKNYIKRNSLELHLRRHEGAFRFFCDECKKGFVSSAALEVHKRTHSDIKLFSCEICNKKFRTNTNLQEHVRFCSGDLPFECDKCDKKFAATAKLNDHVKLVHEKNFKFKCTDCGKGFTKESDFKAHAVSHTDDKPFQCNTCGNRYKTVGNLNHHVKIHKELPYNCELCSKGFRRKENFEAHKNSHSGLKPFICTICPKKFGARRHLDAHLKIHNGTVKKRTCPVCGKQLAHGLTEHMRLHTGIKPFKCNICLLTFTSSGALRKHTKRNHKSQ